MNDIQRLIFQQIVARREYQDGKWGTAFDDANTLNDWVTYIIQYAGKAADMKSVPSVQQSKLLDVAAIVFAALETAARNGGVFPARHYEDRVAK